MKKNKKSNPAKPRPLTPEEALEFIESVRRMTSEIDEPTVPISLRIPANLLRTLKLRAKADGKKYQSLIIEYIRQGFRR